MIFSTDKKFLNRLKVIYEFYYTIACSMIYVGSNFITKADKIQGFEESFPLKEFKEFYKKSKILINTDKSQIYLYITENISFLVKIFNIKLWRKFYKINYWNPNSGVLNIDSNGNLVYIIKDLDKYHYLHNISYHSIYSIPNNHLYLDTTLTDEKQKININILYSKVINDLDYCIYIINLTDYKNLNFEIDNQKSQKFFFIFHKDKKFKSILQRFPLDEYFLDAKSLKTETEKQRFIIKKCLRNFNQNVKIYCIDIFDIQQVEEVFLEIFHSEGFLIHPTQYYKDQKPNFREKYLKKFNFELQNNYDIYFKFS